jgi:hypothetical protein
MITTEPKSQTRAIRIHATNIIGIGAIQLVQSLLPELERVCKHHSRTVYLPAQGELADYSAIDASTHLVRKRRYLPKSLSRVLECTLLAYQFDGEGDLLVLGDIPLRCNGRQTVFVQTPLLNKTTRMRFSVQAIKFAIARMLFRLNSTFVSAFIVQTDAMKAALAESHPHIANRIHVIGQPAPQWLLSAGLKRSGIVAPPARGLRLFYPAAAYPHKNHRLLAAIPHGNGNEWPVASLTLTVEQNLHPHPTIKWINCVGRLRPDEMVSMYQSIDALLFLSEAESLGFPLIEAMCAGLPIICPDLPYARVLCGDVAVYFDSNDIRSLHAALIDLDKRLKARWWPDWREALKKIPESWHDVGGSIVKVTTGQEA